MSISKSKNESQKISETIQVSICCITYNHEKYIEKTLDSFLNQKVDFNYEILIHDDASTDRTAEIILRYQEKYPELIKPILQKKNQYQKLGAVINPHFNYPRALGKYIALCEGDDYWNNSNKLQKQFDFMEKNSDCSTCFTAAHFDNADNPEDSFIKKPINAFDGRKYSIDEAIYKAGDFITTPTIFFRTEVVQNLPDWFYNSPIGDMPLSLILGVNGKYGYLDFVGSVYRINSSSSWTSNMTYKKRRKIVKGIIQLLDSFNKYTKYKYQKEVMKERKRVIFNDRKSVLKRKITNNFVGRFLKRILGLKTDY